MTRTSSGSQPTIDRRALNRALLARQLLLERVPGRPVETIEHLAGMQAQSPLAPYVGLWSRLREFDPNELGRMLVDRRVVRTSLMRTTLHLVSADDCLALRPLLQPVLERGFRTGSPFGRQLEGVDVGGVAELGRQLLTEQPMTIAALGAALAQHWPDRPPSALAHAVRYLVPLVQLPPRGVWGRSGVAVFTTVEAWLGRPVETGLDRTVDEQGSIERLVLRYLAAFGPASVADVQSWSWLTKLRPVVERLRPSLVVFRDETGRELFDVPEGPRPPADIPAPVRFLPEYDNLLLSHAERSHVVAPGYVERVFTRGSFLVDGFVRGAWRVRRTRRSTALEIEPFEEIEPVDRDALLGEAEALVRFLARPGDDVDVRFVGG